jgi:hypothetical protein
VQFGENTSTVLSANARFDLWLFPFLNVYGMYGVAQANTTVEVTSPVQFTSSVDQPGQYYGFGFTTAFGIWDHWASVDLNWAFTDLEKLSEPVRTRILGVRIGHTFPLDGKDMKPAIWGGIFNAEVATKTDGSLSMSEALPQEFIDSMDSLYATYQSEEWYQDMPRWQQEATDKVMNQLDSTKGNRRDAVINYNIDKGLGVPTNMIVGAQWEINKEWGVRTEIGLFGRWSALLNVFWRYRI